MNIILASKSPRRKEILEMINLKFHVLTSDCDETPTLKYHNDIVKELAVRKALKTKKIYNSSDDDLIISCDTIVSLEDKILGKPSNKYDCLNMLNELSGKKHSVISGLCLLFKGNTYVAYEETFVTFKKLSDYEIEFYASTDEPYDKAGGYGI